MMSCVSVPIKIFKSKPNAVLPKYSTRMSAGADLYACLDHPITILPGKHVLISTGLILEIPSQLVGCIVPRSGLALQQGVNLKNRVGIIDADFRGEMGIILANEGDEPFEVANGDRIAQLVLIPFIQAAWVPSLVPLSETERGEGGFGHTGVKT